MASATRRGDEVVLTLSLEEALYVTAELSGGNSYFHGIEIERSDDTGGWDATPYAQLTEALRVGVTRKGPLQARYRAHKRVTEASRPQFDSGAGRKAGELEGFIEKSELFV